MSPLTIATIDQHLSAQGKFSLIDWLLAENLLYYAAYEDWRYGRSDTLDANIQLTPQELAKLVASADTHCNALELIAQSKEYHSWEEQGGHLQACKNDEHHNALTQQWLRPRDVPQLDLFMDNSAVIAENRVCEALAGRRFEQAQQALQHLVQLNSQHPHLGAYQDLVNYGQHMRANARLESKETLAAELQGLQQEVIPLAQEVLGQFARDYLAFAWYRLADNLEGQPFEPSNAQLHRSFALLQIPDWPRLNECLEHSEDLYQQPILLERQADAHTALHEEEAALLSWCFMLEHFSAEAEAAIDIRRHSPVARLRDSFWDYSDTWSVQHFPAFVLMRRPALLHHLDRIPPPELPASQAMIELLRCRREGKDEIAAREKLQLIDPELLRVYLQTRD